MQKEIIKKLHELDYQTRIVPISRLDDLKAGINDIVRQGVLDEDLYREHVERFVNWSPDDLAEARSLIIVTLFSPQVRFIFHWNGKQYPLIAPPTYIHWQETDARLEQVFADLFEEEGFWIKKAVVPQKALAAKSGLAEYGRNNISYVKGMGSFHRLKAYYSNMPHEHDFWGDAKVMDRCAKCMNCVKSCPTEAIEQDRFVVRAERCNTEWNEKPGHIPLPDGLDTSWHNCIVGCMHCQHACPENQKLRSVYEDGGELSEEETGILMKGLPEKDLPPALVKKLESLDLLWMYEYIPRNLNGILKA